MPSLIDRYIFREMLTPFLLGLLGLNGVLIAGRMLTLAELIIGKAVGFTTLFRLLSSLIPSFLIITLPMSCLLATLIAFGRLSADSEIISLKASGVSLHRMLIPVMAFAALTAAAALMVSLSILPAANRTLRELLGEHLARAAGISIQEGVFNDRIPGILLYCEAMDQRSKRMRNVMIRDERSAGSSLIVTGRAGILETTIDNAHLVLTLEKGSIHQQGDTGEYRLLSFDGYRVSIPLPGRSRALLDDSEMTLSQLRESIAKGVGDPRYRRELHLQLHKRFALPLSCFIFGVIGISLGIVNRRSGKGGGFTTGLAVFVSYFVLFSFLKSLGQKGALPPPVAIWTPNMLFLSAGLILYLMRTRDMEFRFLWHRSPR